MKLLIVNYHYFGEPGEYKKGIFPISASAFSRQLDELAKVFSFISQQDLLNAITGNYKLPEYACMITFDDGLRSQQDIALPVLKNKGIPALMFVSSLPYVENKTCLVHKLHYVLANSSVSSIVSQIDQFLKEVSFTTSYEEVIKNIKKESQIKYRYDEPLTAVVKMSLNTNRIFGSILRSKIINFLFSQLITDEESFTAKWYIDKDELKKIYLMGFLGLHSHSHLSMGSISSEAIKQEVYLNKKIIEDLVEGEVYSISFPYGGLNDVSPEAVEVCRALGLKLGFTMERALNGSLNDPLLFARIDTNDAVYGKNPFFKFIDNKIRIIGAMTEKRSLFIAE